MKSSEAKVNVSSGVENRVSAVLLTRNMSRPSELSSVSNTNPATKVKVPSCCNAVQEVGKEAAVKVDMADMGLTKKLIMFILAEGIVGSCVSSRFKDWFVVLMSGIRGFAA